MEIFEKIGLIGLLPVTVINDIQDAVPTALAIKNGGIDAIEITLRTKFAFQAMREIQTNFPDMHVGAGTVLTIDDAKEAVKAGAQFIVTPNLNPEIVEWCIQNKIPVIPGCVTPTEVGLALDLGLKVLKFFPADIFGGVKGCKALIGPFGHLGLKFIPTGGINLPTIDEYADKKFIHALGGGWLSDQKLIAKKQFDTITQVCQQSIEKLLGFEIAEIENLDAQENEQVKNILLKKMLGFNPFFTSSSEVNPTFNIEKLNINTLKIKTNNVERANYHLMKNGFTQSKATIPSDSINSILLVDDNTEKEISISNV